MRVRAQVLAGALVLVMAGRLGAQNAFTPGTNYIGAFTTLGVYGGAGIGGAFEHAINDKWGWGISGSFWSYAGGAYVLGGTGAYHFQATDPKLDPFVGGFIGFYGCSDCVVHGSGLFPGAFGGVRYWIKDNLALSARGGWGGFGVLSVGVDFKM